MGHSAAVHVLIATAAGGLFVTSVLPLNVLFLIAWVAVAIAAVNAPAVPRYCKPQLLLIHFFTFAAITVVAHLAPIKTDSAHFSKRVRLPKTELTVGDRDEIAARATGDNFPVHLSLAYRPETQANLVHFSSTEVSLGDFIGAVENQTPLRHKFVHCGNAYTILWGNPPSYQLMLIQRDDITKRTRVP